MPVSVIVPQPPALASPFVHTPAPSPPAPPAPNLDRTSPKKPKFPADFSSTKMYNRAACYGESLNVLQANHRIPRDGRRETLLEKIDRLAHDALTWCSGWGGVAYWHISLHQSYTVACEKDRDEEWEKELLKHAANGRHLLFQLTSAVERLAERSHEPHKLKELLRISMEMMQMVTMGLTVLNMRCSILPNNVWRVEQLYCDSSSEEEAGSLSSGEDQSSGDSDMFY